MSLPPLIERIKRSVRLNITPIRRTFVSLVSATIAAVVAGFAIQYLPQPMKGPADANLTWVEILIVSLLVGNLVLALINGFSIRRRLGRIDRKLHLEGLSPLSYSYREEHFREEKRLLCEELVRKHLPHLISELCRLGAETCGVDIVVDSGTTLTPMFTCLKVYGLLGVKKEVVEETHIYTNSMSGIEVFSDRALSPASAFPEERIHLLGGSPLHKYRATTGVDTLQALCSLRDAATSRGRQVIGIVTGNWILGGPTLSKIEIAANGRGHPDFKRCLVKISDVVLVVAPLGKFLRLQSTSELNALLENEPMHQGDEHRYQGIEVGTGSRDKVRLLTTNRPQGAYLGSHAQLIQKAGSNYIALPRHLMNPRGEKDQQKRIEVPHAYLRDHPLLNEVFLL